MIRQHLILGALIASLALPAAAQTGTQEMPARPAAPVATAVDGAHLLAVSEMLDAMRMGEVFIASARLDKPTGVDKIEFYDFVMGRITNADVVREVAPVYARYVSESEARALAAAYRRPLAQKALAAQLAIMPLTGKAREQMERTSNGTLVAFYTSSDGKRMVELMRRVGAEARTAVGRWMAASYDEVLSAPLKAIAARQVAWIDGGTVEEPVLFVPERSGLASVDGFSSVLANAVYRNQRASWQLQRDLAPMVAAQILKPANLLAPATLARSRVMLDEVDLRIEAFLKLSDANLTEFAAELRALPMFAQLNSSPFSRAFEAQMARGVKFAENQRTLIDLMRRILTFMEQRKGKVSMKGELLMFDKDADVALYNGLLGDLKREMVLEQSIVSETKNSSMKAAAGKF